VNEREIEREKKEGKKEEEREKGRNEGGKENKTLPLIMVYLGGGEADETGTHQGAQDSLKLKILLPQPLSVVITDMFQHAQL
jgi:hypothetical protein